MLTAECISSMGTELSESMHFISDFNRIKTYLSQSAEMKRVLMLEGAMPSQDYLDLRAQLKRLHIKGSFITLEGLQALSISYSVLCELKKYLLNLEPSVYPLLYSMAEKAELVEDLPHRIGYLLDPLTNQMRDNASEGLYRIRSRIKRLQSESHKQIQKYLNTARKEGWTGENAEVTVRGDRLVIPLISSYKRQIRGFIHDVSSTGQTVFLEPEEVFNLNNELTELRSEERMEIIRILKEFSLSLFPLLPTIIKGYDFLGRIDFIRAKAKLALQMEAGMPILENKPCFTWKQARHPLLKSPIPLSFCLEDKERIVIISGPNAGGKSVCLKTIGLLQYMLQCGLLVPMTETSEVGIFKHIFLDIGDEQSIENDLSTYSSHLKNMKFWLENSDRETLFLADELGSGTEPQVGGAIAESVLEEMEKKGSWGVITTHYTHLKLLAKHHNSMVNGAMLFNKEEMQPMYIFRKGLPGSSFAFEMARKIGFPANLLKSAQAKTGKRHLQFEEELQQIEVEKQSLHKKMKEVELADKLLFSTLEKYNGLIAEIENKRKDYIGKAQTDAKLLVSRVNQQIEQAIREIREIQAEKAKTKDIRKNLQSQLEEALYSAPQGLEKLNPNLETTANNQTHNSQTYDSQTYDRQAHENQAHTNQSPIVHKAGTQRSGIQKPDTQKPESLKQNSNNSIPIHKNGYVSRINGGEIGIVREIRGKKAKVDFDFMSVEIPLDQLKSLTPKEIQREEEKQSRVKLKIDGLQDHRGSFTPYLDLRGIRAEEAIEKVQKLIDDAILLGEYRLEILHGKGFGILKNGIRECLRKNPYIASFGDQKEEFGGAGITIVELKR